jgi:hypothetical membrane protein
VPAHSLSRNTIRELGDTKCGEFNGKYDCSPLHSLMKPSFVVLGVAMFVGSALIYHAYPTSRSRSVGFLSIAIVGVGAVMVGVFPENSISALHGIGAALPFVVGNVGVLVLGLSLNIPVALRLYTMVTGVVALPSLIFYASGHYLGLGEGGIERCGVSAIGLVDGAWCLSILSEFSRSKKDRRVPVILPEARNGRPLPKSREPEFLFPQISCYSLKGCFFVRFE